MVADPAGVDIDSASLGKCQEGEEAHQVDCGDEGKHRCPRACGLNEIPREVHHQDSCTEWEPLPFCQLKSLAWVQIQVRLFMFLFVNFENYIHLLLLYNYELLCVQNCKISTEYTEIMFVTWQNVGKSKGYTYFYETLYMKKNVTGLFVFTGSRLSFSADCFIHWL